MTFADQNASDERLVLEALWATWGHQQPSMELLNRCLKAKDHRIRSAAVRVVRHCLDLIDHPETLLLTAAKDEHPRVRLEALSAASWLGGDEGATILLTVATQPTDRWIRNALNSCTLLLKPNIESLVSRKLVNADSLSVDYGKMLAGQLEGAVKPKDYRTKSDRFKDKAFAQKYALGERVYYEEGSCRTCHREHGDGIARIYPPLAGSEWVVGDPERLTKLTLHGLWGKIQARGLVFEPSLGVPPMTAVGNMYSDEEVAAVLTYVRSSWGHDASEISIEDVKAIRAGTKDRRRFYDPDELIKLHPFPEGSRPPLVDDAPNKKLESDLLAEPLANLVRDALQKGDATRGAKVFYREKTACATCHDARADFQLGPVLTKSRPEVTDEFLLKSILQPSADILAGYQSVNVVTTEGTVVSGYLMKKTDDSISLSIVAEKGKLRVIPMEDVDDIVELKVSTMPAGLAASLADRGEFLDLARFVLDVNKGGQTRLNELKRTAEVENK